MAYTVPRFNPAYSVLAGMTSVQLQAALTAAQQAYTDLMTGQKGVTFSYSQGDGSRTVSYQPTDVAKLTAFIQMLQAQLGGFVARRPARFNF